MESAAAAPAATHLSAEEVEALDAYWRAANYLSVGQIYLLDNPLLREPLRPEHVKPRLLGHFGTTPGLNLIYAHLNRAIRAARPLGDLHRRPGPRRAGARRQRLPRRHLLRGLLAHRPRRGRAARAVPAVLVPRRHPEPRRARDAGLDPRGRRARLLARARVRRGVRQPGSARRLRRRRRRGRDGPARDELALEQVPEREDRRRRAADPAPERLQDREPDGARPHPRGRAAWRCSRLRLRAGHRRRRRGRRGAEARPRAPRRRARRLPRRDRPDPAGGARRGRHRAAALADDRAADAEGLDRPEGGRRHADRGHVALAPGSARRRARQPGAPRASSRSGCGATGPRSCSTPTARSSSGWPSCRRAASAA